MPKIIIPKDYHPNLDILETQKAIKLCKDTFEAKLSEELNLTRVSAPLYVEKSSGLNDHLSGVERPVSFDFKDMDIVVEVVQSLAKWKRMALDKYGFKKHTGLYTDMNAIRRDEVMDNLHSTYVDQWDWEVVVERKDRNIDYLKETVRKIVKALVNTQDVIYKKYPCLTPWIKEDVYFITTQELLDMYPNLSGKERENEICKKYHTVFLMQIGDKLSNGEKHDSRAFDYDDWSLNGDLLVWYPILDRAVELSSMGIRVDEKTLLAQKEKANVADTEIKSFHQAVLYNELPLTMGGGIGQSRICLVLLHKAHVGEVHASIWPKIMIDECEKNNIHLL